MRMRLHRTGSVALLSAIFLPSFAGVAGAEDWPQFKFDARHSGNAPQRSVGVPLGLLAAAPLTDAIFTAPVVADGRVYAVDGAGVAFCLDAATLRVLWKVPTGHHALVVAGPRNCNNVSSPLLAGGYLHFGTMAGTYYVLDAASGRVAKEITCGEPIFSTPVAGNGRVYFATLGSQVYALEADGTVRWTWDYVKERLRFDGDRWSGAEWRRHIKDRVRPSEQFLCSRDIALAGDTLVLPVGGSVVWLEDCGRTAKVRRSDDPYSATMGLSIGDDGTVYRQWHLLDNGGQVDILPPTMGTWCPPGRHLEGMQRVAYVPGTRSGTKEGTLSFVSVSVRGRDIYRCCADVECGFCRHSPGEKSKPYRGCFASIASPVLAGDKAIYGGLDGALYVVPLSGGEAWSFKTPLGKAISAPVAVADGRIYFGCEDGYLYALGPGGPGQPVPSVAVLTQDLALSRIHSPLKGPSRAAEYDRFTSFGDWGNTNAGQEEPKPPYKLHWIRRYEGTAKHASTFGGGRMYTHTAEGMIFAVEEETGRLLWRRYFPGVHISYTAPLYHDGRLLVPQAGFHSCVLRCLDAATGGLLWEAPFAGSPSWNRQMPPVVYRNLAIYVFGTGKYGPEAPPEEKTPWLFGHQHIAAFPPSHRPLLRAYDLQTGRVAWTTDFSEHGAGGDDAGVCLMDGRLYYSCFFGCQARLRSGQPGPPGITAAVEPQTGKIVWLTRKYSVRAGCVPAAKDGRVYLGGYQGRLSGGPPSFPGNACCVWCLDAKDGSLLWESEALAGAIHVTTIGPRFLFVHAQYGGNYLLDKASGKILSVFDKEYKCTRFTLAGTYLMGSNLDVWDLSDVHAARLLASGPRLDPSECTGACVSNGRIFYTGQGAGLQASEVYGAEAAQPSPPWPAEHGPAD